MAWNEPGDNKPTDGNKPKDPWGHDGQRGGKPDSPPDLDEALKQFQDKMRGIFGGGKKNYNSGGRNGGGRADSDSLNTAGIVLGIIFSLWVMMGAYQLDEQEQAIVLRLGVFHEVVGSGFHWNPPIVDKVYKENVTRVRTHNTRGQMLTEDENIVEVDLSVQYNINDLKKFKLAIREPEVALQEATDSALRHVVGSSKMDDVLTIGREKIAIDVKVRLDQYLNAYDTGIALSKVNVEDTKAPTEVQASFDNVSKAREDEERVKNEAQTYLNQVVPEARGRSQRMIEEAKGYRDQTISRAEGEAARFKKLLAEYRKAPGVTRERLYLDTMQQVMQSNSKVMIDVKGGNNMMYLPLDKLNPRSLPTEPGAGATASSNVTTTPTQTDIEEMKKQIEVLKNSINNSGNTRRREARQ